jgi:hypothetical protein
MTDSVIRDIGAARGQQGYPRVVDGWFEDERNSRSAGARRGAAADAQILRRHAIIGHAAMTLC